MISEEKSLCSYSHPLVLIKRTTEIYHRYPRRSPSEFLSSRSSLLLVRIGRIDRRNCYGYLSDLRTAFMGSFQISTALLFGRSESNKLKSQFFLITYLFSIPLLFAGVDQDIDIWVMCVPFSVSLPPPIHFTNLKNWSQELAKIWISRLSDVGIPSVFVFHCVHFFGLEALLHNQKNEEWYIQLGIYDIGRTSNIGSHTGKADALPIFTYIVSTILPHFL